MFDWKRYPSKMKKINPVKPGKTQQNRQKTAIFREIYD